MAAPLQGYTEAAWRHHHAALLPQAVPDRYFSPFLRLEKGELRRRDLRDITSTLNTDNLTPQIIFRDLDEFKRLADAVAASGHTTLDLNLGCPFPPQVKHGRGAALLRRPDTLAAVAREMAVRPDIAFSAKMRLGVTDPGEWRAVMGAISEMPLTHLTVHPRTASQQYAGELQTESVAEIIAQSPHPVIFNGDILTPADIDRVMDAYPGLAGVMIGRGLLARPSLIAEWREGGEWSADRRLSLMIELHRRVLDTYRETLCGDTQILMKIRPFWDYAEPLIGHKTAKAIRKAGSLTAYMGALNVYFQNNSLGLA